MEIRPTAFVKNLNTSSALWNTGDSVVGSANTCRRPQHHHFLCHGQSAQQVRVRENQAGFLYKQHHWNLLFPDSEISNVSKE